MRSTLFLIADYANLTREGKLNVMGIFSILNTVQFPVRHPTMHLIARLEAELGEHDSRQVTIILRDPDGAELMHLSREVAIPGQGREINIILELHDIIFQQPGPHQFVLLVDKDYKNQLTLNVTQIQPANAIQSPQAP